MKNKKDDIKTGIITVHRNINYGANLQAYATCKFLNENGIDAYVIDYLPKEQDKENHFWSLMALILKNEPDKSLKRIIKVILGLILIAPSKFKRLHKFSLFRKKYMNLTKYCKDSKDISKLQFDTVVCGSDQIWNADITLGIDPVYYGDIPGVNKKISYAASLGSYKYPEKNLSTAKSLVENLTACSLREIDSKNYIEDIAKIKTQLVCDPVFLLNKDHYIKLAGKRLIRKKYLLVYSIISNEEMLAKAAEYAEINGLILVEICASKNRRKKHIQLVDLGPEEFLSAFYYADTIITNSFHGTAFSIIFEKNFYIFNNKHGGSRLTNLLKISDISERQINELTDVNSLNSEINYSYVHNNLKELIDHSKTFLLNNINGEIHSVSGDSCVGCGACAEICPCNAVYMTKTYDGFETAYINKNMCTDCGLCNQVCPAIRELTDLTEYKSVYAYKAEDDIRIQSTSGGAFSDISEFVLSNNGVIYGASLNETFVVEHIRIDESEKLSDIRGVKYVQSNIQHCFDLIAKDLTDGKFVLFTGTPCQVSAVKEFIQLKKISHDKLFLVDIICHGVPSPLMFKNYIKWLETKFKSKVKIYKFRNKNISWRGNSSTVELCNGTVFKDDKISNVFMNLYYSNAITRKSCYECRYTSIKRVSDLTISDYWGIENTVARKFEDSLGVSMVLVNTEKGEKLFSTLKGKKTETDINGVKQPQLSYPTEKPAYRDNFWFDFYNKGFVFITKKYGGLKKSILKRIKTKLKTLLIK